MCEFLKSLPDDVGIIHDTAPGRVRVRPLLLILGPLLLVLAGVCMLLLLLLLVVAGCGRFVVRSPPGRVLQQLVRIGTLLKLGYVRCVCVCVHVCVRACVCVCVCVCV